MDLYNAGKSFLGGGHGSSGGFNPMAMFQQLDRNGDGHITESDFVEVVQQAGLGSVGEHAVKQIFRQIDKNRNGRLDLSEALAAYEQVSHLFNMANGQQ
jgi:Ca2+-binding EF-hand superfamily protein